MSSLWSRPNRPWRDWVALTIVALLVALAVVMNQRRADRDFLHLPPEERRALYERTLATLASSCEHPPGPSVKDYCREQAELIERLPECDDACHELVRRLSPKLIR